jgi:hypothetical protein
MAAPAAVRPVKYRNDMCRSRRIRVAAAPSTYSCQYSSTVTATTMARQPTRTFVSG